MSGSGIRQGPSGVPIGNGTIPGQIVYWDEDSRNWAITPAGPDDGQLPTWNAAANRYDFSGIPSVGDLQYFDDTYDPVGLWNFDGTLEDISGNGNDLTLVAGSLAFCDVVPGKQGLFVLQNSGYATAAAAPELVLTGDMTLMAIVQFDSYATGDARIARYTDTGESEAENCLFGMTVPTTGLTALKRLQWFSEHGAGVNDTFDSGGDVSLPPVHNVLELVGRRQSNVIRWYVNGQQFGPDSSALSAPTGGNGSGNRLLVGGSTPVSPGSPTSYVMLSLKILAEALTDEEVLDEYNRTLGPAYGRL